MGKKATTGVGLFIMGLFVFSLAGCGNTSEDTLLSIEEGQDKMMEISEQLMNGEITNEEADTMMEKISAQMDTAESELKKTYDNVSDFKKMPKWAEKLGAYELKGFKMNEKDSSITEFNKKIGTADAISLVYSYNDEAKAIQVAEKLAANMGLEESNQSSPRILQKQLDKTMESMMEYMGDEEKEEYKNNKMSGYIADGTKGDFYIMVSVLHGDISLIINNTTQMQEIMK